MANQGKRKPSPLPFQLVAILPLLPQQLRSHETILETPVSKGKYFQALKFTPRIRQNVRDEISNRRTGGKVIFHFYKNIHVLFNTQTSVCHPGSCKTLPMSVRKNNTAALGEHFEHYNFKDTSTSGPGYCQPLCLQKHTRIPAHLMVCILLGHFVCVLLHAHTADKVHRGCPW